jgi:hypothetical protein
MRNLFRIVFGTLAPVACYTMLAIPIGGIEAHGSPAVAWWLGILLLIATSTAGFVFTTKRLTKRQSIAIGVVYYPVVLALCFYASLIIVGRLYGNYL